MISQRSICLMGHQDELRKIMEKMAGGVVKCCPLGVGHATSLSSALTFDFPLKIKSPSKKNPSLI